MADPLTDTVNQVAPAPLGIFDSQQAGSIISRYATTRKSADLAAESFARQQARERAERDALLADREDLEYAEKQAAKEGRAAFLGDLLKLDPKAEDFNATTIELLRTAPPAVAEDPVVRDILDVRRREADQFDDERRRLREMEVRQQNSLEAIKERSKYNDTMKFLTEEDIKTLPRDENGGIDMFAAGIKAMERKRAAGIEDTGKKAEARVRAMQPLFDEREMDAERKERFRETKDILSADREAFPDRTDAVLRKAAAKGYDTATPKGISEIRTDPKFAEELREAEEWDKEKFKREVLTAKRFDTPEEYIAARFSDKEVARGAKLSPLAEENRRRLWEYANPEKEGTAKKAEASEGRPSWVPEDAKQIRGRWITRVDGQLREVLPPDK